MNMFCFQCQETAKNEGCTVKGVCGKSPETSNLQDLLIYVLRGLSLQYEKTANDDKRRMEAGRFASKALFMTITNGNFDEGMFSKKIEEALSFRDSFKNGQAGLDGAHDSVTWTGDASAFAAKAAEVGIMATENEDVRSLRELLIYGLKGIAAYAHHAAVLGYEDSGIYDFLMEGLASTTRDLSVDEMIQKVLKAGEMAVSVMAILDQANTSTYGNPEITEVSLGVRNNPGILVSGHDLKDMAELLEQTEGTGVDIYTHGEMLPTHYYPAFKKYDHLVGNYGGSWYDQKKDFASFNGPIVMTTNCITPVKDSYKDRIFTTDIVGYPGTQHLADNPDGGKKDFSAVIELAKTCPPPAEIETGKVVGGFAHAQVLALADKVVEAVKAGAIKRFIVMAGCDGRQKGRSYFTEVAERLPADSVILTAGCAKYRYNKLDLGDIGGIPRVLDAGQCNDCYSLAVVALKLKDVFELEDINDLPISFDVAWYEQKAVAVLLALLHLGVKGIRLGPTLPAFLSPNVAKVLVDNFDIKPVGEVKADINAMMEGK